MYRNGDPFFVMGGCILDTLGMAQLAKVGGNTVRTYPEANLDLIMPYADSLGLGVIVGLNIPPFRKGMDYTDQAAVDSLWQIIEAQVLRWKNHPALLFWGIGNELDIRASKKQTKAIFRAVNNFSKKIHHIDDQHPTSYMANGPTGALKSYQYCRDLDIISINTFRSMAQLSKAFHYGGRFINKPVLISEWAPSGYWNAATTSWGAPIEMNAEEKAYSYGNFYNNFLKEGGRLMLGSCLFLWGQKQEQTHSWFSYFTEEGEPTALVDKMNHIWTGHPPDNHAPLAQVIRVDTFELGSEIFLEAGKSTYAVGYGKDEDGDHLISSWEVTEEYQRELSTGGDKEIRPPSIDSLILYSSNDTLYFNAPEETGAYRMYYYLRDSHGKAGIVNVPFYVVKPSGLVDVSQL